jgi:hypothetical protein
MTASLTADPPVGRARTLAGLGGALAMVPYLLIKVSWVAGALLGLLPHDEGFTLGGWVALNVATIAMAATGIALAVALARPWGRRLPAAPLLTMAWVGAGLLVPMLPYLALTTLMDDGATTDGATGPTMPAWEAALITASFAGLGLGLAVAVPLYLRDRWPAAFRGRLGSLPATTPGVPATVAVAASAACGLLTLSWAAGVTLGLGHPETRVAGWYLLMGTTAAWALAGAAALWLLAHRRPARLPVWVPVAVAWTASGMLAAWSAWKLPLLAALAANPGLAADPWPEDLAVAAVQYVVGIVAGVTGLLALRAAVRRSN